ncbi:hypothetical protein F4778DRAFT_637265 [Xylariomycetidae sp. FL2044]|nr:hypothetical protein F4778DRAFT_637265 [Xylariomycetidae sp. FL2044]
MSYLLLLVGTMQNNLSDLTACQPAWYLSNVHGSESILVGRSDDPPSMRCQFSALSQACLCHDCDCGSCQPPSSKVWSDGLWLARTDNFDGDGSLTVHLGSVGDNTAYVNVNTMQSVPICYYFEPWKQICPMFRVFRIPPQAPPLPSQPSWFPAAPLTTLFSSPMSKSDD